MSTYRLRYIHFVMSGLLIYTLTSSHMTEHVHGMLCVCMLYNIVNLQHACAARVTVVGLSVRVCVSVSQHIMSEASVHLENAITYATGNEGKKVCGDFSETALLQRSSTSRIVWHVWLLVGHFPLCGKTHMHMPCLLVGGVAS